MTNGHRRNGRGRVEVGLIGAGIGPSLSPALHEREGRLLGFDYRYRLYDLNRLGYRAEDVGDLVAQARAEGLRGLNITHPCKQAVVAALDGLAPEAAALGAVNTVVFSADGAVGHNTDAPGFRQSFVAGLPDAAIDRVVVIGAGGAGAATAHAMLSLGAGHVHVLDAASARAAELVERLRTRFGSGRAAPLVRVRLEQVLGGADGLIHATPMGMHDHPGTAVPAALLHAGLWVADVVYTPIETQLLGDARGAGCRTLDGGGMATQQAAGSLELFTGVAPNRGRMAAHLAELLAPQHDGARTRGTAAGSSLSLGPRPARRDAIERRRHSSSTREERREQ
jgi:shikimate dehydrogenase